MRKVVWVWVLVAFVVGLLPGAAGSVWLWRTNRSARATLLSRNAQLNTENKALTTRVNSAEASVTALNTKIDSLQAQTSGAAATPIAGATGTAAPAGPPSIYERSVSPTEAVAGKPLKLTVKLTGHASLAKMRIFGGPAKFDKIYNLARESYDSKGEVWQVEIIAPASAGNYHCVGIAVDTAKASHLTSPGSFTVSSK